ncbi:hypothetical protein HDU96_001883 [Phlyctochytrium bullatum]|nr:hypothetical protein HDU96_001883 [Phlyctochytrium bullatum]
MHTAGLVNRTAHTIRLKIGELEKKYQAAVDWRSGTGQGILDSELPNSEEKFRTDLLKRCPHFDRLDRIFHDRARPEEGQIAEAFGEVPEADRIFQIMTAGGNGGLDDVDMGDEKEIGAAAGGGGAAAGGGQPLPARGVAGGGSGIFTPAQGGSRAGSPAMVAGRAASPAVAGVRAGTPSLAGLASDSKGKRKGSADSWACLKQDLLVQDGQKIHIEQERLSLEREVQRKRIQIDEGRLLIDSAQNDAKLESIRLDNEAKKLQVRRERMLVKVERAQILKELIEMVYSEEEAQKILDDEPE